MTQRGTEKTHVQCHYSRLNPSGTYGPIDRWGYQHRCLSDAYLTMGTDEPRVLTIRQPWAWAIIHGGKDVENRSWPTKHRGPLLIHAGSAFEPHGYETVQQLATRQPPPPSELIHGAIIGVVELVDCVRDSTQSGRLPINGTGACATHSLTTNPFHALGGLACGGRLGMSRGEGDNLEGTGSHSGMTEIDDDRQVATVRSTLRR